MKRGLAYCDEHYSQYQAMENIQHNIIMQIANKKLTSNNQCEPITIEEMRKHCEFIWGEWIVKDWNNKMVKEYYSRYKNGEFNLK